MYVIVVVLLLAISYINMLMAWKVSRLEERKRMVYHIFREVNKIEANISETDEKWLKGYMTCAGQILDTLKG